MSNDYDWARYLGSDGEQRPIAKWDEAGKVVKGTVAAIRDHEDKRYAKTYPVIDLNDEAVSIFASQVDLQRKLAERNPQIGDHLAIRYEGAEEIEGGNTVKRFSVQVTKPTGDDQEAPF